MSSYRAVLLDLDGTFVDSNDLHARAWVDACHELGLDVDFRRVRPLIGMGADKLLRALLDASDDSELGHKLRQRRGQIFRERYLASVHPFEGGRDLVARLRQDSYRIVVASSSSETDVQALVAIAGLGDLLDGWTSADDAEQSKPSPDIVQAAIELSRVEPSQAVLLGDTPYDVAAAANAAADSIVVRSGGWPDADLRGAVAIYDDVLDLYQQYDASVFGSLRFE